MAYLFKDLDEKERITYLEKEITRLQELCRNNFGVIADLKKENEKLHEVQLELKETTSDLAYSLAECPWVGLGAADSDDQHPSIVESFRVLVTYVKNIQYILHLPLFFDPIEQLESCGMKRDKALRYLKIRCSRRQRKPFKCPKCKKDFSTEDRKKKHVEFHSNFRKKLHCSQCNKYIQSFRCFKSHLQSHEFTNQMMAFPSIDYHPHDTLLPHHHISISNQLLGSNPETKGPAESPSETTEQKQQPDSPLSTSVTGDMDLEVAEIIPKKLNVESLEVGEKGQVSNFCRLNILK